MATPWWQGAVIYQIYPRSFFDSNGDGVGDLPGVTRKLDYVAALGVDGIWLSPFFVSPMRDFGYDVADYRAVDPIFGGEDDFDALVARAHALGLKVVIDQVYSHTSDRHPWFSESRSGPDNPRSDWYVWADPRPDGAPPNNWLSVFGGPAWSWDTQRRQYYLHNFLAEQPDLNFHQPAVQSAILDVARFWLDRGVDGFRLDVANYYFHDAALRDNPPSGVVNGLRPYHFQDHRYNRSRPETLAFLARLREAVDAYDACMTVGEIFSAAPIERSMAYVDGDDRLHTAYNFLFLEAQAVSPDLIRKGVSAWTSETAWPSWSFSNHDVERVLSRWGAEGAGAPAAKAFFALLCSLRGTAFVYQGEELGLVQGNVPFDKLRDPEAVRFWPETLGRDGCRTPMPWRAGRPHAGFSSAEPWLPVDPRHEAAAVDAQSGDPQSCLSFAQGFLAFRRAHAALRVGSIRFLDAADPVLLFERRTHQQRLYCGFNLSAEPHALPAAALQTGFRLTGCGLRADAIGDAIVMPPYGGFIAEATA
ncbi:MAG: alpha-glucosidase family protein [Pseudomonadota bacterium]